MGNVPSQNHLQLEYRQCKKQQSDILGKLKYVHHRHTHLNNIIKQYTFQNQVQYQLFLQNLKKKKSLNNHKLAKYIVNITDNQTIKLQQICGVSYQIFAVMEYFQTDFETLFKQRQSTINFFLEEQIFKILSSVCQGLIFIYDNNLKSYPICRETLVYNNSGYKIIDLDLVECLHPYFKILHLQAIPKNTYLSPQLLKELRDKNKQPYFSPKSDVFSLGIFILQLCQLQDMDTIYNYDDLSLCFESIKALIDNLNYSQNLKKILNLMLTQCQQDRIGLVSLKEKVEMTKNQPSLQSSSNGNNFNLRNRSNSHNFSQLLTHPSKKHNSPQKSILDISQKQLKNSKNLENIKPILNQSLTQQFKRSKNNLESTINRKSSIPQMMNKGKFTLHHKQIEKQKEMQRYPQTPTSELQNIENTPIRKIQLLQLQEEEGSNKSLQKYAHIKIPTGQYYQGQINSEGKFSGNGVLYYPQGKKRYSGTWKDGLFNGFGILNNYQPQIIPNYQVNYNNLGQNLKNVWTHYQGQFEKGLMSGFGTLYYSTGQKFSGCFKEGFAVGFGTFYKYTGEIVNGVWNINKLKQ